MSADSLLGLPPAGTAPTRARPRRHAVGLVRAGLWTAVLALVAAPLATVAVVGVAGGRFPELLAPDVLTAGWNSLVSSLVSGVLAVAIATGLVVLIEHTDLPGRRILRLVVLAPLLVPPFVGAIAWVGVFGPSSPINLFWQHLFGGPLWSIYGGGGVVFLLTLHAYPVAYLIIALALSRIPPALEEAARIGGSHPLGTLARVTVPLLRPAIGAAFLLVAISNLADFGIPSIVGTPGHYPTLATLIYRYVQSGTVADPLQVVAAVGVIMLAIAALGVLASGRRSRRITFETRVSGGEPLPLPLRPLWGVLLWTAGLLVTALPLSALLVQSLLSAPGVPLRPENLTLAAYATAFANPSTLTGIWTSLGLALGAGMLCAGLGLVLGVLTTHARAHGDRGLLTLVMLPQAVPGLIVAVGWLLLAPRLGLFNTPWLILCAYVTAFLAQVVQAVQAPLAAVPAALVEAARSAGAAPLRALRDVPWRLGIPAALTGGTLVALTALRELTISAILLAPNAQTLGVVIFNFQQAGAYDQAAALSVLVVAAGMAGLGLVSKGVPGR